MNLKGRHTRKARESAKKAGSNVINAFLYLFPPFKENSGMNNDQFIFTPSRKRETNSPQNGCRIGCPICLRGCSSNAEHGEMDWSCFRDLLNKMRSNLSQVIFHRSAQSENFTRQLEMIRLARSRNIRTRYCTDGSGLGNRASNSLIDSGLDEISFIFDGSTKHALRQYQAGRPYQQEKNALGRFCRIRQSRNASLPEVTLQFISLPHNEHELPALRTFASETGVDRVCINTQGNGEDQIEKGLVGRLVVVVDGEGLVRLKGNF